MTEHVQEWEDYSDDAFNDDNRDVGSGDFMELLPGDNTVRFLPPKKGWRSPFVVTHQHHINAGQEYKGVQCPADHDARCPICPISEEYKESSNKSDSDYGWSIAAKTKVYATVIDRADEQAGPKIMSFGASIWKQLRAIRNNATAGGDFLHPIHGFDIIIHRKGMGRKTEYTVMAARASSPLADMAWITDQKKLTYLSKLPAREDVHAALTLMGEDAPAKQETLPARSAGPRGLPRNVTPKARTRTAQDDLGEDEIPDYA